MFLQHWSKLDCQEPCPKERSDHAAVCLNYGGEHPQLLVTGGWNGECDGRLRKVLGDCWILDVDVGKWREVSFGVWVGVGVWHDRIGAW